MKFEIIIISLFFNSLILFFIQVLMILDGIHSFPIIGIIMACIFIPIDVIGIAWNVKAMLEEWEESHGT